MHNYTCPHRLLPCPGRAFVDVVPSLDFAAAPLISVPHDVRRIHHANSRLDRTTIIVCAAKPTLALVCPARAPV